MSSVKCSECGFNDKPKGRRVCRSCRGRDRERPYTKNKKSYCEWPGCVFKIEHPAQLDVDHKDGDKQNNSPENFVTLCANHHRLKTILNRDSVNIRYREKN